MISIIIPLFNQADKIRKCLESIIAQSNQNYEVIVVDDCSGDNVAPVKDWALNELGYKIAWLRNSNSRGESYGKNQGAPSARNCGFRKAKGEFLLFCDADIIFVPDALEIMAETLRKNPEASYAYPAHKHGLKLFRAWPFDAEKMKQMPYIHSTALIRREHFPTNGWDESVKRLQDWDLWLTMLENGHKGIWIDQVLFTIVGGGYTMSSWLPSFAYTLLPFLPKVRKYKAAVAFIKLKHGLP